MITPYVINESHAAVLGFADEDVVSVQSWGTETPPGGVSPGRASEIASYRGFPGAMFQP